MYSAMSLILLIERNKIDVFFIWWLIISCVCFVIVGFAINSYFFLYQFKNEAKNKNESIKINNKSTFGFFLSKGKKGQSMFSVRTAKDITSLANQKGRKVSTNKYIAVKSVGKTPKSLFLYKVTLLD
jgi:hypothetical protein